MPQIELKYSNDVKINSADLFAAIEKEVNTIDSSAGVCKSRAMKIDEFMHTHVVLSVSVLKKHHRDDVFMKALLAKLAECLVPRLPSACYYSIQLDFLGEYYITSAT